jgi:predicted DNA-binding transcriptional regulator AlpA
MPAMQGRLGQLDQRMSTNEVLRILGINRSTLYRWRKKRKFPPKHDSGGWRRSDVEKWFADNPDGPPE